MKKNNLSQAIDYLTITTNLSKIENDIFDYSQLILKLKGEIPREDLKKRFKMKLEDFDNRDVIDFYGIENFDEINSYIEESGMDVDSACLELNMTDEQIDIIKLIYAREFYLQGNYEKGDLFFQSVERSKNKTRELRKLLREIEKNKKFYQFRQVENTRCLSLKLVPKKSTTNNS